MLNKFILIFTLIISLSFTACSSLKKNGERRMEITLINTHWKALSFYEKEVKMIGKEAYIRFDKNGNINGVLGCNNFFGTYKIDKNSIVFKKVGSTRMMCQDMEIEDNFSKALQNTKKYKIEGNILTFFNKKGEKISTFNGVYF